jgi:SAM-dependent methyltransferase
MLPALKILERSADSIPMSDGSFDAACVGQAFDWFATSTALGEIRGGLKPSGHLALIWNRLDHSSAWASEINRIIDRLKGDAPKYEDGKRRGAFERLSSFEKIIEQTFSHTQMADLSTMLDRFGSTSHVVLLENRERQSVLNQIEAILCGDPETASHDRIVLRYRTEVFIYQAR